MSNRPDFTEAVLRGLAAAKERSPVTVHQRLDNAVTLINLLLKEIKRLENGTTDDSATRRTQPQPE